MSRGKYAAKATKRRETQELEAEVASLRHTLSRTTAERDEARESLRRKEVSYAEERRGLLADIATGASTRTRALEVRTAELDARLDEANRALKSLDDDHTSVWRWLHAHLQEEHGMGYADSKDFMFRLVGITQGGMTKIGVAGASRDADWVSLLGRDEFGAAAIQRARGLRR